MQADGYKGIWFTLGQFSEYGDKYSGGLGTYTRSHSPMAIYLSKVNQTVFCYGGTRNADERHLLIMVGMYDHQSGMVAKPTIVWDLQGVDDPHDNPSLLLDDAGYIWVFISGRNTSRPGRILKATKPYSIEAFEPVSVHTFTYPQPHLMSDGSMLHLFTKYTGVRELYWSTSTDGANWAPDQKLAGIGGHYQVSLKRGERVVTAFNRHPEGHVDHRTDLYYIETNDAGKTWCTIDGRVVETPLNDPDNVARVHPYSEAGRLVYLHHIEIDAKGHPVILYSTSNRAQPGPHGDPRFWEVAAWDGNRWCISKVTQSTHNYDAGFIDPCDDQCWRIYGPSEDGPQHWGCGGEVALWESRDQGASWSKARDLTSNSEFNHSYVRHPANAHPDFYAYWADGNPDAFSESRLYFANKSGTSVWRLPYTMTEDLMKPEQVLLESRERLASA